MYPGVLSTADRMKTPAHPLRSMMYAVAALFLLVACIGLIQTREAELPPKPAFGKSTARRSDPGSRLTSMILHGTPPGRGPGAFLHIRAAGRTSQRAIVRDRLYPATGTAGWFAFTLSWDDASPTWADASDLLLDDSGGDPAMLIDARGFVIANADGHLVFSNTGERARFWGINLGGDASLPPCPDYPPQPGEFNDVHAAEKLAARLAKLGFNAVRVHMIDEPWSIIWLHPWEDTKDLNPVGLGRLDYFIYQLKRHAIYVDLNLHAAREFTRNDGVTAADAFRGTRSRANTGATLFDPVMIALQKRYAEQLLRHVNPYTGLPYADDPVILTTETSNEDSFFRAFCGDQLNHDPADPTSFPEFYSRELDGWTHLSSAGPTINRLLNPGYEAGLTDWYTYTDGSAQASFGVSPGAVEGSQALRIQITQADGVDRHVQFGQGKLALLEGKAYHLTFAARASQPATVWGAVMRDGEPWDTLGWRDQVALTTEWVTHTVVFTATETIFGEARVSFDVGQTPLTLWFDAFRFHEVDAFRGWLGWLEDCYGSTAALAAAWAPTDPAPETEMLANGSFESDMIGWYTWTGGTAAATWSLDATQATSGTRSLKVTVTQVDGSDDHVWLWQPGLEIQAGQQYQISFDARTDTPGGIWLDAGQAHEPWENLGLHEWAELNTAWGHYEALFEATQSEADGCIAFSMGQQVRTIWLDNVSLKPYNLRGLLPGESLEENSVARLRHNEMALFTPQRVRDLLQFYYETQVAFFTPLRGFIQDELGSRSLNTGTAGNTSNLPDARAMAALDFVDNHWYWDFPSSIPAYGEYGWFIHNRPWVNEPAVGLFDIAVSAVRGRPSTLTEFGESFPNDHAVEGPLTIATFANLQDWDAVFTYGYANGQDLYAVDYVAGLQDLVGNPLAAGEMPVAARIFMGQQNAPAPTGSLLSFTEAETYDSVAYGWGGFGADFLREEKGVDLAAAFGSRLRIADFSAPAAVTPALLTPSGPVYHSDGGQLTWDVSDPERGLYTFNAPEAQGAVGFMAGRAVALTNLALDFPADTAQFAAVTMQSQDDQPIAASDQLLMGVFTRVENTGMVWNADRTSLEDWGTAPTLIEPVRFTATLTLNDTDDMEVWALDETGAPHHQVAHQVPAPGRIRFVVDTGADKTLWYAIGRIWTVYLPLIQRR